VQKVIIALIIAVAAFFAYSAITQKAQTVGDIAEMGLSHFQKKEFDKAEGQFLKALSLQPKRAETHFSLGSICIKTKKYNQALKYLNKAIEIDPLLTVAHANKALALAYLFKFDEALVSRLRAKDLKYSKGQQLEMKINTLKASHAKAQKQPAQKSND
jgi:tetratricopeptide (TPR) repeat protein